MADQIDDRARALIEAKNFCLIGSVRPDGSPQVNPVWVDVEDDLVVLNSAEGRAWPRNVRQNPRVALVIQNMDNPYEYVQISGRLAEDTHDGADGHIDKLAKKYLDADSYPHRREGEQRVILKFRPERVMHWGG